MRRIPLYKKLTENYFNGKDDDYIETDNIPDSLLKCEYQFMVTIYGNSMIYQSSIDKKWNNFTKFIIKALEYYDIIDSPDSIKSSGLFYILNNIPHKMDINNGSSVKNILTHKDVKVCLVYDITGYLLYDITSDEFIHQEDSISNTIGKFFERFNIKLTNVTCGICVDTNKSGFAITNRLDISTISSERLNKLNFQNTLSDKTIDATEVSVNKSFTYKDLKASSYTYNITLYRLLRNQVITSVPSYSMSYEIEDDLFEVGGIDAYTLIDGDKQKTKKLIKDIIDLLKTSQHNQRMWIFTSKDKQLLHLTTATDIVVTYNDERYIVNIESTISRSKLGSGYKVSQSMNSTDIKITNKFLDICNSLGNNKDEVIDTLINLKAIPSDFK